MKRVFRSVHNRVVGAVAVTGLLLIPLGVFGGSAFGHSAAAQYQYRVTICHHTGSKKHPWHLITISNKAVPAHLRHHDQMPPCPTTATVAKHHGKPSSDTSHGQSSTGTQGHESSTQGHESSTQGHENNQGGNGNGKDDSNGHHGKP
jgi:hypothetical protein